MGELRGRTAAGISQPILTFSGQPLFPLPKQLFRLYTHLQRYMVSSGAFLPRASGRQAVFQAEKHAYETEFGLLSAADISVVAGTGRLPREGDVVFVALALRRSPEDWAHALVFRTEEKTEKLYAHLKHSMTEIPSGSALTILRRIRRRRTKRSANSAVASRLPSSIWK